MTHERDKSFKYEFLKSDQVL